jgi:hypothetical protein
MFGINLNGYQLGYYNAALSATSLFKINLLFSPDERPVSRMALNSLRM